MTSRHMCFSKKMRRSADLVNILNILSFQKSSKEIEINKTLTFDVFQSESMALEVVVDSDEAFGEVETNVRAARQAEEEDVYTTMIPSTTVNMTEAAPTADPNPLFQNVDSDRTDAEIPRKRFTALLIVVRSVAYKTFNQCARSKLGLGWKG